MGIYPEKPSFFLKVKKQQPRVSIEQLQQEILRLEERIDDRKQWYIRMLGKIDNLENDLKWFDRYKKERGDLRHEHIVLKEKIVNAIKLYKDKIERVKPVEKICRWRNFILQYEQEIERRLTRQTTQILMEITNVNQTNTLHI